MTSKRILLAPVVMILGAVSAFSQQRPLLTEDVDIIKPGVIRVETGFEFLQDQRFPVSGLRGDVTKFLDTKLSFGMSPNVEFQMEWTVQNFLSINSRGPSAVPLKLGTNLNDSNDVGDAKLWMKMKLRNETRIAPAIGFRFGVELPNSDQSRGIGLNTTNFFATVNDYTKRRDLVRDRGDVLRDRPGHHRWRGQRISFDSKNCALGHRGFF